jgi:hypothetical protein
LAFYFSIENSEIINETKRRELLLEKITVAKWIRHHKYEHIELLLSAIEVYLNDAIPRTRGFGGFRRDA